MSKTKRRKVFISYHDEDREYKDRFARMMRDYIIDRSVKVHDIDDTNLKTATIRQKIRDDFIADATVTVVLIGPCTWQRKHVDWEIGSSLRDTQRKSRCGLLGILLPNHPDYNRSRINPHRIPPRLASNWEGEDPYALVHKWPKKRVTARIRQWIHEAFERRKGTPPNNGRPQYRNNRSGNCSAGWKS